MTPFVVLWTREALDQLAEGWLAARAAGSGEELTTAMDVVERAIARDPATAGESREGADRVMVVGPAVVWFELFVEARVVVVKRSKYSAGRAG